jgi:hypothetical protein
VVMPEPQFYGFYSFEAAKILPSYIYATHDGSEVWITTLTLDPKAKSYNWPDKVCVGQVVKFISKHEAYEYDDFHSNMQ